MISLDGALGSGVSKSDFYNERVFPSRWRETRSRASRCGSTQCCRRRWTASVPHSVAHHVAGKPNKV